MGQCAKYGSVVEHLTSRLLNSISRLTKKVKESVHQYVKAILKMNLKNRSKTWENSVLQS